MMGFYVTCQVFVRKFHYVFSYEYSFFIIFQNSFNICYFFFFVGIFSYFHLFNNECSYFKLKITMDFINCSY